jgi:GxxExxY protein
MNADQSHPHEGSKRVKLLEEDVTREIIGAFYEVYNALGFGFLESIYKRALEIALRKRGLRVDREYPIRIFFDGQQIGFHRVDILVDRRVVVEVKARYKLLDADRRQLINYLTAMNLDVGLLLHFGPKADFKRILRGWRESSTRGTIEGNPARGALEGSPDLP